MLVPAGSFVQGDDHAYPEEAPSHLASVSAFSIDIHPVTNAQFADFVADTGYVTTAETAGAAVFNAPPGPVDLGQPSLWWRHNAAANWRRPNGVDRLAREHDDHPVVCVTAVDALAYAVWVGAHLPTEAEWEWAAGAGLELPASWPLAADGMLLANVWLGEFPWRPIRSMTPATTPVGAFPPNASGLFDMLGNVWELTADPWTADHRHVDARSATKALTDQLHPCCGGGNDRAGGDNCSGHRREGDDGDGEADNITGDGVVAKGGSYLCAANYCRRYRPQARHRQGFIDAACHVGFRCVHRPGSGANHG